MPSSQQKDPWKGVEIAIISDESELKQYDDSEEPNTPGSTERSCYIEAKTGAAFSVRLTLTTEFDLRPFKPGYALKFSICYDGESGSGTRREIPSEKLHKDREHQRATTIVETENFVEDPTTRKWLKGRPTFGSFITDERCEAQITPQMLKGLGQIVVALVLLSSREERNEYPKHRQERISSLPEKALKGTAVTNTVWYCMLSYLDTYNASELMKLSILDGREHIGNKYRKVPVKGHRSMSISHTFKYRSHKALQILGCIPRTPSPPPDLEQQNAELRARLAQLEQRFKSHFKTELPKTANLKRELDTDEGEVEIVSAQPTKRPQYESMGVIDISDTK